MKTAILVALAYFNGWSLLAQDCDDKLFFLEAIKNQFFYQDTIITTIDDQQIIALDNGLYKSLQDLKCYKTNALLDYFFTTSARHFKTWPELPNSHLSESEIKHRVTESWNTDQTHYLCYSFYRSRNNWYTLTFLQEAKYVPTLILVNYNPQGRFNAGRALFSQFIDAGDYFVTSSLLQGDMLIVSEVKKWETHYQETDKFVTVTDSIATSYVVRMTGQLFQVDESRMKFEN